MPNIVATLSPSSNNNPAGASGSINAGSLDFGSGSDRAVVIHVTKYTGDVLALISSVVVGGVTLTPGADIDISNEFSGAGSKSRLFTGVGIPSGSQSVTINWTNPNVNGLYIGFAGVALDDAATLTQTDAGAFASSGTAVSIGPLTSATGDLMLGLAAWQVDVRAAPSGTETEQYDALTVAQTGSLYCLSKVAAGTTTSLGATAASTTGGWRIWGVRAQPGVVSPQLAITTTLDLVSSAISMATILPSSLTVTAALDPVTSALALAKANGVIPFPTLRNGQGFVWANRTDITAYVKRRSDDSAVVTLTNVATDSTGAGQLASPLINAATDYRVTFEIPPGPSLLLGAEGTWRLTSN